MQTVSGGRQSIGGGVRTEDDRGGADVSGTTEGAGQARVMREGNGGRVSGIPPDDVAWKGEGVTLELRSISHGRQSTNILDSFPDQERAEELPCGGLPRKGWDTVGDEDAFMLPGCPGHRDHLVGGKPPTLKVLTMQHYSPMAGPTWEAPRHRDV